MSIDELSFEVRSFKAYPLFDLGIWKYDLSTNGLNDLENGLLFCCLFEELSLYES